jgi:fatty acid desaturase
MIILGLLAQVTLLVLQYGAHVINVSLWVVLLPAILLAVLWVFVVVFLGHMVSVDTINPISPVLSTIGHRRARAARLAAIRRRTTR